MVYTLQNSLGLYAFFSESCKKANIRFNSKSTLSYKPLDFFSAKLVLESALASAASSIIDLSMQALASFIMNNCCMAVAM